MAGFRAVTNSCPGSSRTIEISLSRFDSSSSAAGSSTSSAAVGLPSSDVASELPEKHRGSRQFLLATGDPVARRQARHADAQVGPVRPGVRCAPLPVPGPGVRKRICQVRSCRPAVAERQLDGQPEQALAHFQDSWPQLVRNTPGARPQATCQPRPAPDPRRGPRRPPPRPEGGIALLQGALIASPVLEELWFHVEHAPVQVPAPLLRPLLDQPVNLRVDCLNGKDRRQLGQACSIAGATRLAPRNPPRYIERPRVAGRRRLRTVPPAAARGRRYESGSRCGGCGRTAPGPERKSPRASWSCPRRYRR